MNNKAAFIPIKEVIFPGVITTIFVGRDQSIKSLEAALLKDNKLMLFLQRDIEEDNPSIPSGIERMGVLVNIIQSTKLPDGIVRVLLESEKRVKLLDITEQKDFYEAEYEEVELRENNDSEEEAIKRKILEKFEEYLRSSNKISPELVLSIRSIRSINKLIDLIASNTNINIEQKQELLETGSTQERAYKILGILEEEIQVMDLEKRIDSKVKDQMTSLQRNYYLKEKIKAIKEELGEDGSFVDEADEVREAIEKARIPDNIREKLENEASKLLKMPPYSSEFSVVRNYIDTVLELPWLKSTKDILDIKRAEKILEEQHYGLKEVKERILEFLAVKQLNKNLGGTVLCLVGPPGVGKTSIAKSIAESLKRRVARISLGGIKDEAEIRGHRRTYVGAMPGRIIKELKYVDSNNPVILLDEIDKMAQDFRGDPASALLEVLDPEQNREFLDHYLNLPFDLSKVFFIATANDISQIPCALRDRLEIINLSSYTDIEKMNIAKLYLIEKSKIENGLKKFKVRIGNKALLKIINEYTSEAGVRNLKRTLDKIFRKIAKKSIKKKISKIEVRDKILEKYLGKPKYLDDKVHNKEGKVGVVNGLAWTAVGGKALVVQAVTAPGKGKLITTGTLGEVMKESALVALSFVESISPKLNISSSKFNKEHIHIHFPAGATPKDGPSAGIAIVTAIISALTKREVRQSVAMTGEVTITGEVLPIGGVKEKIIGALRAGIKEVILPVGNKADADYLPKEIKKEVKIHFAEYYIKDVLDKVLM